MHAIVPRPISSLCLGVWAASIVLGLSHPVPAQVGEVDYVIHISVDGLRGDLLEDLMTDEPDLFPNFWRLRNEGAATFNARTDYSHTVTVPNHFSMITGRPVLQPEGMPDTVHHGFTANFPADDATVHSDGNPAVEYKASTFDVAHDRGLVTGFYSTKDRLEIVGRSYDAEHGAPDMVGMDNGRAKIDSVVIHDYDTPAMIDDFTLRMLSDPLNYTFMHIVEPDDLGHSEGWGTDEWNESIAAVDTYLGQLFATIDASQDLQGLTAIVLTADHGGGETTARTHSASNFAENYTIPLFVWGAGLPEGSDLYEHFENRYDPGSGRPLYTDAEQPLRNGDSGNIAMQLLGLPNIPGSLMQPVWSTVDDVPRLDFDLDDDFDRDDLDQVMRALCRADGDLKYDVNGDQLVNHDDLESWLAEAAFANGLTVPYFPGDMNLDGRYEIQDFESFNNALEAWFSDVGDASPWLRGDFNADCFVDGSDFNIYFVNTYGRRFDFAAVPEPTVPVWLCVAAAAAAVRRRVHGSRERRRSSNRGRFVG